MVTKRRAIGIAIVIPIAAVVADAWSRPRQHLASHTWPMFAVGLAPPDQIGLGLLYTVYGANVSNVCLVHLPAGWLCLSVLFARSA